LRRFRFSLIKSEINFNLHFCFHQRQNSFSMETVSPNPTLKEFLLDTYKFSSSANVLDIKVDPKDSNFLVLLDKTIFHPQGGGQPGDTGVLEAQISGSDKIKFNVKEIVYNRDTDQIWHKGGFDNNTGPQFSTNSVVSTFVDEEKRRLNARLHSAGHLLDVAVSKLKLPWIPGKGYHFADGPYVEYVGAVPSDAKNLTEELTRISQTLIDNVTQDDVVVAKVYEYEDAKKKY